MDKKKIKQFILQLSAEAGEFLRNNFYTFKNVFHKDIGSLITNIDLELEEILIQRIQKEFPSQSIWVQGAKKIQKDSEYIWIIDALDGSMHFSRNIPIYTVNIALQYKGETIFGAVNHPQTHQLFFGEKGGGAYLNGIDIRVSDQNKLSDAFIFIEFPEKKFLKQKEGGQDFNVRMEKILQLAKKVKQMETFRIGAFGQCLVAAGSFDAYIDLSGTSSHYGQAASHLIVKEAGGDIFDIEKPHDDFIQVMATNTKLTKFLRKIVVGE